MLSEPFSDCNDNDDNQLAFTQMELALRGQVAATPSPGAYTKLLLKEYAGHMKEDQNNIDYIFVCCNADGRC